MPQSDESEKHGRSEARDRAEGSGDAYHSRGARADVTDFSRDGKKAEDDAGHCSPEGEVEKGDSVETVAALGDQEQGGEDDSR